MSAKIKPEIHEAVRFSRILSLPPVVALGTSVGVGLGIFTLLGLFVQAAGRQTVWLSFLALPVIVLPLILTYAERAAVVAGSGGALNLAQRSGKIWLTYAVGWLLLGGYASLTALLGWGVAIHFNLLAENLFNISLDLPLLAVVIIGVTALYHLLRLPGSWKMRSRFIYVTLFFLVVIIIWGFWGAASHRQTIRWFGKTDRVIGLVALMVSGLWGIQFILNIRDEIQRPTKTILRAMLLIVAAGSGLGLLSSALIRFFVIIPTTLTPLFEITKDFGLPQVLVAVLYAFLGSLITLVALNQTVIHGLRLMGEMAREGFFPERFPGLSTRFKTSTAGLVLVSLFSIVLVNWVPVLTIVGLASLTFLWVTALVHLQDATRARPYLPDKRSPKLPFHPLFPWLTVAVSLFLSFHLEASVWWLGGVWSILGALYFVVYARQSSLAVHRQEVVVSAPGVGEAVGERRYRVLVGIANPETAPALLQTGARLARLNNGELLALNVLTLPEQVPAHLKRQMAQNTWEALAAQVKEAAITGVNIRPLVRLAPEPLDGILEAIREEQVDLLVVGWPGQPDGLSEPGPLVDGLIKRAPCEVAVLRHALPPVVRRILAPTSGGPDVSAALALGQNLAAPAERQILVEKIVTEPLTPDTQSAAKAELDTTLAVLSDMQGVESRIVEAPTVKEGILKQAGEADLLLIGVSRIGFAERSYFGGLAADVAAAVDTPVLLVRSRQKTSPIGLMRLFELLSGFMPAIPEAEREVVLQQMRHAAQPSVDFFVLITLAATIASMGLLLNSTGVIIGAMLVAPLMSPILAMGMSIVQGDFWMLRVAAEATSKGILAAIVVGITMTALSPINAVTGEILGRTSPNLLDLAVALASGAAAGYAVGRKEVFAALPGVAISVALVPPLCVVGYGLATSQLNISLGALLLFTTNLGAIVLAASIVFLALGFQPTRAGRTEVLRGLKVAATALIPIALILTLVTSATVVEFTRRLRLESIVRSKLVTDTTEMINFDVRPQGLGFVVNGTMVDVTEGQLLDPQQVTQLENELQEAIDGPLTFRLTNLSGTRYEGTSYFRQIRLEVLFQHEMAERNVQIEKLKADEQDGEFTITTTLVSFGDESLTSEQLSEIQDKLSQAIEAPVTIRAVILPGSFINTGAPAPKQSE